MRSLIKEFNDIGLVDVETVGVKNALLGELYNRMGHKNHCVPYGFAVTMQAYDYFIASNALESSLGHIMEGLDRKTFSNLESIGAAARKLIMGAKFPPKLESTIIEFYTKVFADPDQEVAVRSSLNSGNTGEAYAKYETFLNIKGNFALLYAIKYCFASLYSDSAIRFREGRGGDNHSISISVGVQQMVRSDLACSGIGVVETVSEEDVVIKISGVWGLGTNAPQANNPDEYIVRLSQEEAVLMRKKMGDKSGMLVHSQPAAGINTTTMKITPPELREKFTLEDHEVIELAKLARIIQGYFQNPMLIEWAKDGIDKSLYITGVKVATAYNKTETIGKTLKL